MEGSSDGDRIGAMREDVSEWVAALLPDVHPEPAAILQCLSDGSVLCRLAQLIEAACQERLSTDDNSLQSALAAAQGHGRVDGPGKAARSLWPHPRQATPLPPSLAYVAQPSPAEARRNIQTFLAWCAVIGLPDFLAFSASDLIEGVNERAVLVCLIELGRLAADVGLQPPMLVALELDIRDELHSRPRHSATPPARTHQQAPPQQNGRLHHPNPAAAATAAPSRNHADQNHGPPPAGYFDGQPVGLESGLLCESCLSSSSTATAKTAASGSSQLAGGTIDVDAAAGALTAGSTTNSCRLRWPGSWTPSEGEDWAACWLQADLRTPHLLTGVQTQGDAERGSWVSEFALDGSLDAQTWVPCPRLESTHDEDDDDEHAAASTAPLPAGNFDAETVVTAQVRPVVVRYVRLRPREWRVAPSVRWEPLAVPLGARLGLADGRILDDQLTASSCSGGRHAAKAARLDGFYSWVPDDGDEEPFLQVRLREPTLVTACLTQGGGGVGRITRYRLATSIDGHAWSRYTELGRGRVFDCELDAPAAVCGHALREPRLCLCVRFYPVECIDNFAARLELVGRPAGRPFGLASGHARDALVSASSSAHESAPHYGRLRGPTAWRAAVDNEQQFWCVDLEAPLRVTALFLQGNPKLEAGVASLTVEHSCDGKLWQPYQEGGRLRIVSGCQSAGAIVVRVFWDPFVARFVRLRPTAWFKAICLRVELLVADVGGEAGLRSGTIRDDQLASLGPARDGHGPAMARLGAAGSWLPDPSPGPASLGQAGVRVRLDEAVFLRGVLLQGAPSARRFVTACLVETSAVRPTARPSDGTQPVWQPCATSDASLEVAGAQTHLYPTPVLFPRPALATAVRILPTAWHSAPALRAELFVSPAGHAVGIESGALPDACLTFSSSQTSPARETDSAAVGRLNGRGAWRPSASDASPRAQVDLLCIQEVTAVIVQGDGCGDHVELFHLETSLDGKRWAPVRFTPAGSSSDPPHPFHVPGPTSTVCALPSPCLAQHVRLLPKAWRGSPALRLEVYARDAGVPLGLCSGAVEDSAISSSSHTGEEGCGPAAGRLYGPHSWVAGQDDDRPHWKVDAGRPVAITALLSQGQSRGRNWVSEYELQHSLDGSTWATCGRRGEPMACTGNRDNHSVVATVLPCPIVCRYLRILSRACHVNPALRVEALHHACGDPVGLEHGQLPDARLTFSNPGRGGARAGMGRLQAAVPWAPTAAPGEEVFVEVDLGSVQELRAVITQGGAGGWVTAYSVHTSVDGAFWQRGDVALRGNDDESSLAASYLAPRLARHVRIVPVAWHAHPSLRFELLAADAGSPLGLGSGALPDEALVCSSALDPRRGAAATRFGSGASWVPTAADAAPSLTVDLQAPTEVSSLLTRGDPEIGAVVSSFAVETSLDGERWVEQPRLFSTPVGADPGAAVPHRMVVGGAAAVLARFLRIAPRTWVSRVALQLEVYGRPASVPVGLHDHRIPDGAMAASSARPDSAPSLARLLGPHGWRAGSNAPAHLQVDLARAMPLCGVSVQGDGAQAWVTSLGLATSQDGRSFEPVLEPRTGKRLVLRGNADATSIRTHRLALGPTRFIRVECLAWQGDRPALRLELFRPAVAGDAVDPEATRRLLQRAGLHNANDESDSELDQALLEEALEGLEGECRHLAAQVAEDVQRVAGLREGLHQRMGAVPSAVAGERAATDKLLPVALKGSKAAVEETNTSLDAMIKRLGELPSGDTIIRFDEAVSTQLTRMQTLLWDNYGTVEERAEGVVAARTGLSSALHALLADQAQVSRHINESEHLSDPMVRRRLDELAKPALSVALKLGREDEISHRVHNLCQTVEAGLDTRRTSLAGLQPVADEVKSTTAEAEASLKDVFTDVDGALQELKALEDAAFDELNRKIGAALMKSNSALSVFNSTGCFSPACLAQLRPATCYAPTCTRCQARRATALRRRLQWDAHKKVDDWNADYKPAVSTKRVITTKALDVSHIGSKIASFRKSARKTRREKHKPHPRPHPASAPVSAPLLVVQPKTAPTGGTSPRSRKRRQDSLFALLDPLDDAIQEEVFRCTIRPRITLSKMDSGKYFLSLTKKILFIRLLRTRVMVRVPGGWDTLSDFLLKCAAAQQAAAAPQSSGSEEGPTPPPPGAATSTSGTKL